MSDKNNMLSLIRAEKERISWKTIIFYSLIVSFCILLIFSLSVLSYNSINYNIAQNTTDTNSTFSNATEPIPEIRFSSTNIPIWSIVIIGVSFFGLMSVFAGNYAANSIVFEKEGWLKKWERFGKIEYDLNKKTASILSEKGKLSITKVGAKYKLTLPKTEGQNFKSFGMIESKEQYSGLFSKAELTSILYIFFTLVE